MQSQNALVYRQVVTLQEGTRVLLRPLTKEDYVALTELYASVEPDELAYFRHDVSDPKIVAGWIENLDYDRVFPLVAVLGNKISGNITLHLGQASSRHIGEVRLYLAKEFRGRGLGTKMVHAIIDIARRRGLLMLEVRVVRDQVNIIQAFHNSGFITKCEFEDAYLLPNNQLRDVEYLILRLRQVDGEF
jgi:L-amino acid N-acyltransferase YncA